MTTAVLLSLLVSASASAAWLPLPDTPCIVATGLRAKTLLRYAGIVGPLRRATIVLCDTSAGGIAGMVLSRTGTPLCPLTGTLDGRCITLSACGAVGPPLC